MYEKHSKNVGNGSYMSTEFTVIACRSPYAVFLGRHSAREIDSIALDETHDKNMASCGSQKRRNVESEKMCIINENNSDVSSDRLNSMNHKTDQTIRTSFWIEKLTKFPATTIRMISNRQNFCRNYCYGYYTGRYSG